MHALGLLEQWGLIERRRGSGCYVREPKQRASSSATPHLAFIAPNNSTEIFMQMCRGVDRVCHLRGIGLMVSGANHHYDAEREQVHRMVQGGAQAIVLAPVSRRAELFEVDYLRSEFLDFPIVLIGSAWEEQGRPAVVFDNRRVGFELASYLLDRGHRRIAFMDDTPEGERCTHLATYERHRGLEDALRTRGFEHRDGDHWRLTEVVPGDDLTDRFEQFVSLWEGQPEGDRATAVFAWHDGIAVPFIQYLLSRGIRVPDDLDVIGFDDLLISRSFTPAFPTTRADFERAGEIAAEIALEWAVREEPRVPPRYVLPVAVVIRRPSQTGLVGGMAPSGAQELLQ